jgi:hypothetical protein
VFADYYSLYHDSCIYNLGVRLDELWAILELKLNNLISDRTPLEVFMVAST